MEAPRRRKSQHGRRLRRRQGALAGRPVPRRGVRNRYTRWQAAGAHSGGTGAARSLRVSATGAILAGPHGSLSLARVREFPDRLNHHLRFIDLDEVAASFSDSKLAAGRALREVLLEFPPNAI